MDLGAKLAAELEMTSGLGLELEWGEGIEGDEEEEGIGVEIGSVSVTQDEDERAGDTVSARTTRDTGMRASCCDSSRPEDESCGCWEGAGVLKRLLPLRVHTRAKVPAAVLSVATWSPTRSAPSI